jgi:uncharacterized protein (DUF433 family)
MQHLTNLPTKASGVTIQGKVTGIGNIRIFTSDGWTICELYTHHPQALADDIAEAIRMARDSGFEQGRAHVRAALGTP